MSAAEKHVSLGVRVVAKHERNLRRLADRKGYKLTKSRARFPAPDCDMYAVIDLDSGGAVNPPLAGSWVHSWHLDDVELFFRGETAA